jgi:hypothetical protein
MLNQILMGIVLCLGTAFSLRYGCVFLENLKPLIVLLLANLRNDESPYLL